MAQTDLPKFLRDPKYAAILKKAVEVEEASRQRPIPAPVMVGSGTRFKPIRPAW
jgi:hypothetical protein